MKRIRLRIGLRIMMLLVTMAALFFSWIGIKREMQRENIRAEIRRLEFERKSLVERSDNPIYGDAYKQGVKFTDAAIAKHRAELGQEN